MAFVLALAAPFPSYAGYGSLLPPAGWSQGGAAVATFKYASAATETSLLLGRIGANAALTVAGSPMAIPVGLKLASNAALKAAEYSFGNPYLFVGVVAASVAIDYYKKNGFEVIDGIWQKSYLKTGTETQYRCDAAPWAGSKSAAAAAWVAFLAHQGGYSSSIDPSTGDCLEMYGSIVNSTARMYSEVRTSSGTEHRPATRSQFEQENAPFAVPDLMPKELPAVEWPVEEPVINPDPADKTKPVPLWVPTGQPVKNPSVVGQPDSWTQPGVRVTPSPTVSDPWRVDISPEPKTKGDPSSNSPIPTNSPPPSTSPNPSAPPVEFKTCGLPGQPKCQIDETGTAEPVLPDVYKSSTDDYRTKEGELKDKVSGDADKNFFANWSTVFITPPLASCTGYVLPRDMGTIDPCPVVDGVRSLMAYIWAVTALVLAVGMVKKVI